MAEKRPPIKTALVVFGAGTMIQFFSGIRGGIHQDWMRMSLSLFLGVFFIGVIASGLLMFVLRNHLSRLEAHLKTGPFVLSARAGRTEFAVGAFMVISGAANIVLALLAGFRSEWLRLALHLAAFAVITTICGAVLAILSLGSRLSHLEQQIADTGAQSPEP